jgi:hypothetical protein
MSSGSSATAVSRRTKAIGSFDESLQRFYMEFSKGKHDDWQSVQADLKARQLSQWYMLSFEGCEDEFTSEKFDRAFSEYDLFRLLEQPRLLLTES